MARGSTIARRWARALFEAAQGANSTAEVGRDLQAAVSALWGDDEVRRLLLGDRVPVEAKRRLVSALSGAGAAAGAGPASTAGRQGGMHRLVSNFLLLALDKRREAYVPEMASVYTTLSDRAQGLIEVEVRTAVDLTEAGRENLRSVLASKLGRQVRTDFVVDPLLMGGLCIRVDDRLFDASLRRRLQRLGEQLAKARVGV